MSSEIYQSFKRRLQGNANVSLYNTLAAFDSCVVFACQVHIRVLL